MANIKKKCDFCGKERATMVKGVNAFICTDCLRKCFNAVDLDSDELIDEDYDKNREQTIMSKPSEIIAFLDEYVVGQDNAKEKLAVAIYNHYKIIKYKEDNIEPPVEIEKSNVIMPGPTGSGKTYIIKILAKMLGVPLAIQDATSLTQAG